MFSAWPSQVMVLRNASNFASSVMPDMYMKRFLKVGEASWKIVWPPGSWHTDITAQARMRGSFAVSTVPKNEPKLSPETPMRSASISGRADEPVDDRLAGRRPSVGREIEPEDRRLVLPRSVDREHRDAAVEPAVAVERDHRLLEAVHAGDRDHRRNAAALVARRQMEPARDRLALERNPDRLDVMVGERGISGEALALLAVERDVGLVVLVIGPLRRAPIGSPP